MRKNFPQSFSQVRAWREAAKQRFIDSRRRRKAVKSDFIDNLRRVMWRFSLFVGRSIWFEETGPILVIHIFALLSVLSTRQFTEDVLSFVGSFLIALVLNLRGVWWLTEHKIPWTYRSLSIIWAGVFALAYVIALVFF